MNKISTENLELLPNSKDLQSLCKSVSVLEAIICQDWDYRYFSYQKDWSETEEFCEMRNGQGDQILIAFNNQNVVINGFAHESEMNGWKSIPIDENKSFFKKLIESKKETETKLVQKIWKGVLDELPNVFNEFIFGEPVKSIGTTFCIWKTKVSKKWEIGKIEFPKDNYKDGSKDLLELLDGNPLTYKNWAEDYYEEKFENRKLKIEFVEKIYNGTKITKELVLEINPDLEDFEQLKSDLNEIGYESEL